MDKDRFIEHTERCEDCMDADPKKQMECFEEAERNEADRLLDMHKEGLV